ncbi:hypothetical protein IKT18_00330 [Candidatus Saccharibacteria bacterium]|nr:hypothetical protein [Candidatus Saccharibacteria bacterium]
MDENPSGAQPAAEPVTEPAPAQPAAPVAPAAPVEPAAPASQAAEPAQSVAEPSTAPVEAMPVTEAAPSEKPKKKTGLIVAICAFVALVCAGVAVALLYPFGGGQEDRVPRALAALFSEGAPTNVEAKGTVTMYQDGNASALPITSIAIDFDTKVNTTELVNTADAKVTVSFTDETEFSFNVHEIHTKDGDLYLKLSELADAIDEYIKNNVSKNVVDCDIDDIDAYIDCMSDTGEDDESLSFYFSMLDELGVIDVIDDEWILIPASQFSTIEDLTSVNAPTQCLIDALGTVNEYSDDLVKDYNNNPFITYSTENLSVTKKKNTLYKLSVDAEKLAGFMNSLDNYGFVNEVNACMGETAINTDVEASDLTKAISALPATYVEIDNNNMFTRVYLKAESSDGTASATADIDLSYPTSISIEEPNDYIDLNELLSEVITVFYGGLYY